MSVDTGAASDIDDGGGGNMGASSAKMAAFPLAALTGEKMSSAGGVEVKGFKLELERKCFLNLSKLSAKEGKSRAQMCLCVCVYVCL